jgi:3-deoxy-manno-octulosonate cytidylyltransferase (CMP-KDO synthetase)
MRLWVFKRMPLQLETIDNVSTKIMSKSIKTLGVIPARYASSRFPGKPLADIFGKPMVQWVYERALQAKTLDAVVVATDDTRIADAVEGFGGRVVMTAADHPSGTDRCAEVARRAEYAGCEIIVNVQGDEPGVEPATIDALVYRLLEDPALDIATTAVPLLDAALVHDPHVVKVVGSLQGRALYFSRSAIPYVRREVPERWPFVAAYLRHLGMYAYRRQALLKVASLAASPLEQAESLEQLRWLENGLSIGLAVVDRASPAVDTPADLEHFRRYWSQLTQP